MFFRTEVQHSIRIPAEMKAARAKDWERSGEKPRNILRAEAAASEIFYLPCLTLLKGISMLQ